MASDAFTKKLLASKANWKKAGKRFDEEGASTGFECPVVDGIYKANIDKAELTESGKGKLQVHFVYVIASGKDKGEQVHDYDGLETSDNMFYFARKLSTLGIEIDFDDPESIKAALKKISKEKPLVRINVKTKKSDDDKEWTHVYVNRLLEEGDAEDEDSEDDAGDDEEEDDDDTDDEDEDDEDDDKKKSKKSSVKSKKKDEDDDAEDEDEPDESEDDDEEDDDAEDEDDEDKVELSEDMKVTWANGKKEGTILKFLNDNTKARIETEDGKVVVACDKLTPAEDEDEAEADEDDGDEEGDEEDGMKKGDRVKIKGVEGKKSKGTVVKVKGDIAIVNQDYGPEDLKVKTAKLTVVTGKAAKEEKE
jgi:hypothetical protein